MALSYLPCCQPRRPTARAVSSSGAKRPFICNQKLIRNGTKWSQSFTGKVFI
jgi:hypothetical protein